MSCSCRAAPWRAFVQGLAQVHKVDAPANALLRGRQSQISSTTRLRACFDNARQLRSLHASPHWANDDATTSASAKGEAGDENPSVAAPTVEGAIDEPAKPNSKVLGAKHSRPKNPRARSRDSANDGKSYGPAKPGFKGSNQPTERNGRNYRQVKFERTEIPQQDDPSQARPKTEDWKSQKIALKEKFPEGWKPRKRLSPDALAGIRALNAQFPDVYTTEALANKFEVPAEAIRRILKSKWQPSVDEEQDRQERWFRRGMSVWERKAALGIKPPKKWREAGIARDPSFHEWSKRATQQEKDIEEEEAQQYRERRAGHRGRGFEEKQSGQYVSQREKRLLREQKAAEENEQAKPAGKAP